MFIPRESYYRTLIRPEHWDEFASRLPKLEAPFSAAQQSNAEMTLHFVAQDIMAKYREDYPPEDEE